jgi:hypothetical protein
MPLRPVVRTAFRTRSSKAQGAVHYERSPSARRRHGALVRRFRLTANARLRGLAHSASRFESWDRALASLDCPSALLSPQRYITRYASELVSERQLIARERHAQTSKLRRRKSPQPTGESEFNVRDGFEVSSIFLYGSKVLSRVPKTLLNSLPGNLASSCRAHNNSAPRVAAT